MRDIYNILEVANTHGGNLKYIYELLKEFDGLTENIGIKFQPFKYDEISLPDYDWYEQYKKLFIPSKKWNEIIKQASETKDIWIDIFDNFSIKIIKDNLNKITGLKFQASILNNEILIQKLSEINLEDMIILLNISSYDLNKISVIVDKFNKNLDSKEIILQIGFQNYPTNLQDSGLSKILILKNHFDNRISFADHTHPDSEDAIYIPIFAYILGADIIEKHIRHSNLETNYDYHSSMTIDRFIEYARKINNYTQTLNLGFITKNERSYLQKTEQKPVLNKNLEHKDLVNIKKDLEFKRTNKKGLDLDNIKNLIKNYNILNHNKRKNETLVAKDFRKATIAAIVACRLKSTRLPKKAVKNIGSHPSIELCLKNVLKFKNIDHVILATSTLEEDKELKYHTYSDSVIFHRGDPEDVIQRYLDIINELNIDIVIRLTGDMPYVSSKITDILLNSHFKEGADYTRAEKAAIGTAPEIINTKALKKIKSYFLSADYSEYMTYYFTNNPSYFKLNFVDLPEALVKEYRLTLDYEADLEMLNEIQKYFEKNNLKFNINHLFDFLEKNPNIAEINKNCDLKYETDKELIKTLKEKTSINQEGKNREN